MYVREAAVVGPLDDWIATVFDAEHIDQTCDALAAASEVDQGAVARAEAARRTKADCDDRLRKNRFALEAGTDPVIVSDWIAEVKAERLAAEHELGATVPKGPMTKDEVRALITGLRSTMRPLAEADSAVKAELYAELGIRLVYHSDGRVIVESRPRCTRERVGGPTQTVSTRVPWATCLIAA